jgi:hypothetical protein
MSGFTITMPNGSTITADTAENAAAIAALLTPQAAQATVEVEASTEAPTSTRLRMKTREAFIEAHDWAEPRTSTSELARQVVQDGKPLAEGWVVGDGYRAKHGDAEAEARNEVRNEAREAKAEASTTVEVKAPKKSAKKSAAAKKAAASKPRNGKGRFVKADAKAEVVVEAPVEDDATAQRKADLALLVSEGWPVADALELLNA